VISTALVLQAIIIVARGTNKKSDNTDFLFYGSRQKPISFEMFLAEISLCFTCKNSFALVSKKMDRCCVSEKQKRTALI
jgi:hypothetical protein